MKRTLGFLFTFVPAVASAEVVDIRSGEHDGFSRLAIEFDETPEWIMGRTETGYAIRFQSDDIKLDLGQVFRRMSRNRISSLAFSEETSTLELTLGCDCFADVFDLRNSVVVIDIKDGPIPALAEFEAPFFPNEAESAKTNPARSAEMQATSASTTLPTAAPPPVDLPDMLNFPKRVVRLPNVERRFAPPQVSATPVPETSLSPPPPVGDGAPSVATGPGPGTRRFDRLQQTEAELLRQISRAASQGLLEPQITLPVQAPVAPETPPPAPEPIVRTQPSETSPPEAHVQVNAQTSIDKALVPVWQRATSNSEGQPCLDSDLFAIDDWGDENDPDARIYRARSTLLSEFDAVDASSAQDLARAYIYATFGAEAQDVLRNFGEGIERADLLNTMAQIMDSGRGSEPNGLVNQLDCAGDVAMWAVLAQPMLARDQPINKKAVAATFSALPIHLRRYLGPPLIQRFLDMEDYATARTLRNAIVRAPGEATTKLQIVEAQLEIQQDNRGVAEVALQDVVAANDDASPEALLRLIASRIDRGLDVDAKTLATTEALAAEYRGTDAGAELSRSLILAQGQSGQFESAFRGLRTLRKNDRADTDTAALWEHVARNFVGLAQDAEFLRLVFGNYGDFLTAPLSRQSRRQLSDRLVSLGLPDSAEDLLVVPEKPASEDLLVLAQAALVAQAPERALRLLAPVQLPEATELRTGVFQMRGDYLSMAKLALETQDGDTLKKAYWRAGEWDLLRQVGSDEQRAAANLMLATDDAPVGSENLLKMDAPDALARVRSLLASSQDARSLVGGFLQEFQLPGDAGL